VNYHPTSGTASCFTDDLRRLQHTFKRYRLNTGFKSGSPCPTMSPSRPTGLCGIQGSEGYSHADLLPAGRHRSYVCEQLFNNYRDLCESEKVTHFIPPTRWRVFLRRNGILKTIGVFPSCPL
jgi:hypothetical protein